MELNVSINAIARTTRRAIQQLASASVNEAGLAELAIKNVLTDISA